MKRSFGRAGAWLLLLLLLFLLLPGCAPRPVGDAADGPLSARLTACSPGGCSLRLQNDAREPFYLYDGVTLQRWRAGAWRDCSPIRADYEGQSPRKIEREDSGCVALDWSFGYGYLPGGLYRLKLEGYHLSRDDVWTPRSLLLSFRLPRGAQPAGSPISPEDAETSGPVYAAMEQLSGYQWLLQLENTGDTPILVDQDYELYRLEGGCWQPLTPEYRLPGSFHSLTLLDTLELPISPAVRYAGLDAGDYLLRAGILPWEGQEGVLPPDWACIPEAERRYVYCRFSLTQGLEALPLEADPADPLRYTGGSSGGTEELHITLRSAGAEGCVFTLQNLGSETLGMDYEYPLYYTFRGEWFPLLRKRRQAIGLPELQLAAGESRELRAEFSEDYGPLQPGCYRLLLPCTDGSLYHVEFEVR